MSSSTPSANSGKAFNKALLFRIYALALPYKGKLVIAIVLTLSMAFLGPLRPYLIQYTLDNEVMKGDMEGLVRMIVLIFLLLLLQSLFQVWSTILTNFLGQRVIRDLRNKVYRYLTSLKLPFYDKTPVGTLVTRTVSDIETIADVFSEGLVNIMGDLLQIVFILGFMFYSDWKLTLVSLSVLPILIYAGYLFKEAVRKSFTEVRNEVARLNTFVQEHIQGMQIVQLFNKQQVEYGKFETINASHRNANIKSVFYYSVFFPVVEVVAAVSTALIVWYGARGVLADTTTVGMLVSFIMFINLFFRPIRQLADRFNTLQMGMVASERIFKLIDDSTQLETSGTYAPEAIKGTVVFENCWFAYNDNQWVLKDISVTVEKGNSLAIIGATGSGKSSMIQLLGRLYDWQKGNILIDGIPIRDYEIHALRRHIAVVLQDVFLFSGSVMDNIKLYHTNVTDEQVIAVSKQLGAHAFIEKLPNGYNQQVLERGASLSVGQRQLISFVRAMVTNPAILILDEATSSVDNETEKVVQQAIQTMMQNRTSIVIAHRLSTIEHATEIVVMQQGSIIERGTHQRLLEVDGVYKKLHQVQFAKSQ
ncbi:MAG: ABC transporter ATP-binding protein/permease [Bacteroidia bacterium]|jgi:ATP-binding cassette subfamily B protein|nr:ABC transporter ATP-binding protein/permease [Bacteroidia bacterium]